MKKTYILFTTIFLSVCGTANAQYGLGTPTPDASAILDLSSTSKGLLMPRMTTVQQTALVNPAIGLTVFNTTTGQLETNKGDGLGGASWSGGSGGTSGSGGSISFVESGTQIATVLDSDTVVSAMTLSPGEGTYAVTFNGEYNIDPGNVSSFITTPKGVVDLLAAYSQLNAMSATITTHAPGFGLGETLTSGVYSVNASATIAGNLYLNGNGNSNSLFIFKINGALGVGDAINIFLSDGAQARNIFWVTEGAISIGANSTVKGNFLSHGFAVAMGTACILEGRMLSTIGAITTNASTINAPLRNSVVNLGILSAFSLFTSSGAVENTGVSFISGHVGSNVGAITGITETIDCKVFRPETPPYPIDNSIFATFSVYQNNILIPTSTRTVISKVFKSDVITVSSKATITAGQSIDVSWNTTLGTLSLVNRSLTLMKIQ